MREDVESMRREEGNLEIGRNRWNKGLDRWIEHEHGRHLGIGRPDWGNFKKPRVGVTTSQMTWRLELDEPASPGLRSYPSFVDFCFICFKATLSVAYRCISFWCIELLPILSGLWISINFLTAEFGPFTLIVTTNAFWLVPTTLFCSNDIFQKER